jgi:putative acetyltransferase
VIIRDLIPHDVGAVRQLLSIAFGAEGERVAELAERLAARPDRPGASLVAEVDGRPVGHVQLSRGWVDAQPRLVEVLILSPLGVLPAYQRQGIGRALCTAAVQGAEAIGAPAAFLEGDPGYYGKLGWERASARGFTAPSTRIPDVAFQMIVLPAWKPWMTGALVYNDTFWAMDCVGLRDQA